MYNSERLRKVQDLVQKYDAQQGAKFSTENFPTVGYGCPLVV